VSSLPGLCLALDLRERAMPLTDEEKKAKDLAKREEFWPKFLEEILAHQKGLWADEGLSPAEMEAEIPIYLKELRDRFEVDWEKTGILQAIKRMLIRYGYDREYATSFQAMVNIGKITIHGLEKLKSDLKTLLEEEPDITKEELEEEIESIRYVPKMSHEQYIKALETRAAGLKAEVEALRQVLADVESGKLPYDRTQVSSPRRFFREHAKRILEETQNRPPPDGDLASSDAVLPPPAQRRRPNP